MHCWVVPSLTHCSCFTVGKHELLAFICASYRTYTTPLHVICTEEAKRRQSSMLLCSWQMVTKENLLNDFPSSKICLNHIKYPGSEDLLLQNLGLTITLLHLVGYCERNQPSASDNEPENSVKTHFLHSMNTSDINLLTCIVLQGYH